MASSILFTLEDAHQGLADNPIVLYRIRVTARGTRDSHPRQVIKYLTAPSPPEGASKFPDHRGQLLAFDTVPAGDWNLGRLVLASGGSAEGKFILDSTEMASLEEAVGLRDSGPPWCNRKVELLDLLDSFYAARKSVQGDQRDEVFTDIQCMNHLSALVLPSPAGIAAPGPEVVGVWAWHPGHAHGIAAESHVYSIIQARDPGIAPSFLAHITDNGSRVIGFLLKRVADAREAGPADLDKCRDVLSRLHALGIAYNESDGQLKRHSFLVCGGDKVLLRGFGGSFETTDEEILGRELRSLEQVLARQPSELEQRHASELEWLNAQRHI
ncbi:hypothetical protein TOPH_08556 [Tolypocladium ophioglossoides CBS 100239]|uniref:Aminoglycoside phosphotransferase domain-containing protein n=1 Tax=Tolypocladium ophioglossoides (strain CBS 100239) TaxID=1163406 RepID=A0A0L0MYC6_TOLOC|nr:hypothetical protein TOPH_08556 [Tolypocladium ophioglossoides CBS 100239]